MRTACIAPFLLLLVLAPAIAAGATRYEGAGFIVDLPDGFDAVEGYTGRLYHLDVVRGPGAVFLRLVVVPRADVAADALAEQIATDLARTIGAGAASLEAGETGLAVAGAKRTGTTRTYGAPGKPEIRLIFAAIRDGGQTVALVARIDVAEEEADRARLAEILATLRIRTISEDSLVGVRAATVRFRVPLVTKIEWTEETGRVVGQFGLPEGRMTLVIQDCGTTGRADAAVARAHEDSGKSLDLTAVRSGVTIRSRSMTAIPARDDLVIGSAHRLALPAGPLRDQVVFPMQDGRLFVCFSFLADEERREAMSARIAQVLDSLVTTEPPFRAPNLYVGRGLRIAHGSRDALAIDGSDAAHPAFSLAFEGPFAPARILLDVRPAGPEEAAHDRALLARGVPAEGRETTSGPAPMLGGEAVLRVTTYADGDDRRFVATATAPFGDAILTATVLGPEHVRADLLLAFRSVLARIAATTGGELPIADGPVSFRFDPRIGELVTEGSRTNRRIGIRGDRVRGSLVRLPALVDDAPARLPDQLDWAERDFMEEETERGATAFSEPAREERTIDGHRVVVSRRTYVGADGGPGTHVAFAALLDGEFLRASVAVPDASDAAAVAAARRILETLSLR